jgi:hypothetical protein
MEPQQVKLFGQVFTQEERQRLRVLLASDAFYTLFVQKILVPKLHLLQVQLNNPTNERETDLLLKGQRLELERMVKAACDVAGLQSPLTPARDVFLGPKPTLDEPEQTELFDDQPATERQYHAFPA